MAKTNGPWSPLYGQAWDHEKTARAVAHATAADRRIPRDCASSVVLGWLNRLNLWCLSCAEDGTVSALSDAKLGMVAWPEGAESRPAAKVGALVRASLRAGGFLEGEGAAERIHEFRHHHRGILRKRDEKREKRSGDEGGDEDHPYPQPPSGPMSPHLSGDLSGDKSKMSGDRWTPLSGDSGSGRVGADRTGAGQAGSEDAPPVSIRPGPDPEPPPDDGRTTDEGLAADLSRRAHETPAVAAKVVRELVAEGVDRAWIAARVTSITAPIGGFAWKRSALAAWRAEHPRTTTADGRPDFGARSPEFDPDRQARREADRVASDAASAEFAASGYVSRQAWQADRAVGALRTGEDAARRRFQLGRGAYDAEEAQAVPCSRERRAPLTMRRTTGTPS